MAVTHYDLTATFTDLLGTAYSPTSAKVVAWIETNVASSEGIVDEVANSIALGGSRQVADSSGNVTWTGLVGSDSAAADINLESGTLQYRVTAEYVDAITRRRKTWTSGWFSLTADIDLADVVAETYVPAAWMTTATATLQTYVDAGQAAATTAAAASTTASGAADTAVNAAGLASEIAMGDGGAALAAADLDPGSAFRVQNDPRMAATYAARTTTRTASATPASNNTNDRDLVLGGSADFSKTMDATYLKILGGSTLGTPATGYKYTPELTPHFTILDTTTSGHNESLSTPSGRTGATAHRTMVYHGGQGDAVAFNAYVELYSTPQAGSTHWLANAAGVILNGDNGVTAGDHQYMNSVELNHSDNGFDSAAIGAVLNFNRTNDTASQGEVWMGVRIQSNGTKAIDAGYSATGLLKRVLDATQATLDANKAAITLKAQQRIYFNATTTALNGVDWFGNNVGATWIECGGVAGGINIQTANSAIKHNDTQILTTRRTGWAAATGTATRATFDTATVTLPELAARVKALTDDLTTHGLIGA